MASQEIDIRRIPSYIDLYQDRISRLDDAERPREWFLKFNLDEIGIYPKKITSAVILTSESVFDILLASDPGNGYHWGDHDAILDEHNVVYRLGETYHAILIQTDEDHWVIICGGITYPSKAERTKFHQMLFTYGISKAFNIQPNNT